MFADRYPCIFSLQMEAVLQSISLTPLSLGFSFVPENLRRTAGEEGGREMGLFIFKSIHALVIELIRGVKAVSFHR